MTRLGPPVLLVVYDDSSVAPTRLARVAADIGCRLVFVCPDSEHARQMRPVLDHLAQVVDRRDHAATAGLVAALAALRPSGITTFSESQIAVTAALAHELRLPYHDVRDIAAITTKAAQRDRFRARGVDSLRSMAVADVAEADAAMHHVGLPAIVKPDCGLSSRNTVIVHGEAEYRAAVTELLQGGTAGLREERVVVEEPLVGRPTPPPWGDYIAVDCLAQGGVVRPLFVTAKFALAEPFRERGGYGPPVVAADEVRAVQDLAVRAVTALNISHGVADVEIKLTADGPRVIEVNGRLGGWVDDLAMRSGAADAAAAALRSALGMPVELSGTAVPRIAFHYVAIAPMWARRVRAVPGVAGLRSLPGVDRVAVHVRPGSPVDWRAGTQGSQVAAITGTTDTHDELAKLVERIQTLDWIELD